MGTLRTVCIVIALIVLALIIISISLSVVKHLVLPQNQIPVIGVDKTVINATVGEPIIVNGSITDDGIITSAIWDKVAGPKANFTQVDYDLYFTAPVNGTYIFKLEAQDNSQAINEVGVQIVAKGATPVVNETQPPIVNETQPPIVNETQPPVVTPPPVITPPPAKELKIVIVGDVADSASGNQVFQQVKKENVTYYFVVGDLGYDHMVWFKSTYGSLGDKMFCLIGNHEADNEDGNAAIEKETKEFCGNSYWIREGVNLFLMINTNDNQDTLITAYGKVLSNSTIMNGVKNIHFNGHKGCATPSNSHHDAGEIKKLCDYVTSKVPTGVKIWYNTAHNHVYSESKDKVHKQVGTGGKSHYTCPSTLTTEFPYCNNVNYGYLLYTIKPDGTTTSVFKDFNGRVIH